MNLPGKIKQFIGIAPLLTLSLGICSCQKQVSDNPFMLSTGVSYELAEFRTKNIKDVHYQLFFHIPEAKESPLQAQAEITCNTENTEAFILDLKIPEEQIDSVYLNGKRVNYEYKNEHLRVTEHFNNTQNKICVYYKCSDQSLNRRDEFLYTLLVPDRARTLFPCFDQPNLKALYKLSLEIPANWKAVANGKIASSVTNPKSNSTIIHFKETEPISTYLFSFVAGKLNQETFHREEKAINIYHRENDPHKTAQCNDIATEVFDALEWMEEYTHIPYPFSKYDLIIIPGFQFGGMEHIGATLYTDSRMFLNSQPTLREQLMRSSLIAHETAHMWFGDYVTMKWFDDVWTKEVFANYFASLITEPRYPEVNHRLNFMLDYIPGAYNEDRTAGSNPIKQELDNLERAGLVYGNIIYNKSPWVMSSLSDRMGKDLFRKGMQIYLKKYANKNATWDDLVAVLDNLTPEDLTQWSHCWVNEKGRPTLQSHISDNQLIVTQNDEWKRDIVWPEKLTYVVTNGTKEEQVTVNFVTNQKEVSIPLNLSSEDLADAQIIPNTDGKGYGLFLLNESQHASMWKYIQRHLNENAEDEILRGSLLINLYENLRHGSLNAENYQKHLIEYLQKEPNSLLYTLALGYLSNCQQWYDVKNITTEEALWQLATGHQQASARLQAFRYYIRLAQSENAINQLYKIWETRKAPGNCQLSEKDYMNLSYMLALRLPEKADKIISTQASRITQPDRQREFKFVSAATSPSESKRDSVFAKLLEKENRRIEPWASDALSLLNHPIYGVKAVKYIRPALEEMIEIQRTGDIFFPRAWARALLHGHNSHEAAEEVRHFFAEHPDYPLMLGNKIRQQAEHLEKK